MSKIVMFSDLYLPTFPFLDLPLYHELKSNKVDVKYILEEGDIRLTLPELKFVYEPITTIVKKAKQINNLMSNNDLLVMRFCYKGIGGDVANQVRASKKRVLMLDPAAVDLCHRECPAQYITSKSSWMTEQVKKKFPNRYKEIYTTGTIHFDGAWDRIKWLSKKQLMELHGLDPNKKLAILCKASQGEIGHQFGVDDEYKQIVEIVKQCPDYELLFKCHPVDHLSEYPMMPGVIRKNEHYGQKPSWLTLFPRGIKVLKPELGYNAFGVADVIINVRSSVGMESMLFPTPLINVNSHKYLTNWPKVNDDGVMKNIDLKDLQKTLSGGYYIDRGKCKAHMLKYCDPVGDGMAYKRTADIIRKLIK